MASVETDQAEDQPKKPRKGYTPPKGRPTTHTTRRTPRTRLSPTVEWLLAGIVFILVLGAIFYFGRSLRSAGGGGGSAPLPAPVVQVDDAGPVA
jgi:hypothetical protein